MVIAQTFGNDWRNFISEETAKTTIQDIENANRAIRAAIVAKVGASATPGQREQALKELRAENPLFDEAVDRELRRAAAQQ